MKSARMALFEALYAHLKGAGVWGEQVEPGETVSAAATRPFVHFFASGGGREVQTVGTDSARLSVSVKVVADTMGAALRGQGEITALLHDAGDQDVNPRLPDHPEWRILHVTEDREIYAEEAFEGASAIYHAGHVYSVMMEAK